jgi:hypothetical protein
MQDAVKIAVINDTIFAFVTWKGLVRYLLDNNGGNWSLTEDLTVLLPYGAPQEIAADSAGLYIAWTKYGLYSYNKMTLSSTAYYRTGLDFQGYTDNWPVTDLFCKDGFIFITEYFGQTTILSADPSFLPSAVPEIHHPGIEAIHVYPNPFSGFATIEMPENMGCPWTFILYNSSGQLVKELKGIRERHISIASEGLSRGIYFFTIIYEKGEADCGKLIVE